MTDRPNILYVFADQMRASALGCMGDERVYTFWHYMRKRWERNAGLRLDHLLLSPDVAQRLKSAGVDRVVRDREGASDHAPVWVQLR